MCASNLAFLPLETHLQEPLRVACQGKASSYLFVSFVRPQRDTKRTLSGEASIHLFVSFAPVRLLAGMGCWREQEHAHASARIWTCVRVCAVASLTVQLPAQPRCCPEKAWGPALHALVSRHTAQAMYGNHGPYQNLHKNILLILKAMPQQRKMFSSLHDKICNEGRHPHLLLSEHDLTR